MGGTLYHKIFPYILIMALIAIGLSITIVANRIQNPEALQEKLYAQQTTQDILGRTCSPKNDAGMCTGYGEVWEPGTPADCMRKGGIPVGGTCSHVCCKLAGELWPGQDTCSGLARGNDPKKTCEAFNECPFNYMCKWDELTQTCGPAQAGEMMNPWCPLPTNIAPTYFDMTPIPTMPEPTIRGWYGETTGIACRCDPNGCGPGEKADGMCGGFLVTCCVPITPTEAPFPTEPPPESFKNGSSIIDTRQKTPLR